MTVEERFWAKVQRGGPTECWLWTASRSDGYGHFHVSRARMPAHRYAYELLVGPIPEGLILDHLCRVRHCVNPAHLEPVTSAENTLRGYGMPARNARKTHCKYGHEFTPENTRRTRLGRECRTCRRLYEKRRDAAERAAARLSPTKGNA